MLFMVEMFLFYSEIQRSHRVQHVGGISSMYSRRYGIRNLSRYVSNLTYTFYKHGSMVDFVL